MNNKKLFIVLWGMFSLTIILPVAAQESEQENLTLESLLNFMGSTTIGDSSSTGNAVKEFFHNPAAVNTLNKIWQEDVISDSRLLKDLNIKFKTFEVKSEIGSRLGLGLSYSFSKDITRNRISPGSQAGVSLSLKTEGNVAFEKNINPEDFLSSVISFHLFKSWGGTFATTTSELRDSLNEWETELALIEDEETFAQNPLLKKFISLSKSYLSDQFYADFYLSAGLESDQEFGSKQFTYGANLGIDIKLWRNEDLNIFDWPFAAIRWLSGYDDELDPIGGSFPTLMVSLERISPNSSGDRLFNTGIKDYTRLHSEIVFKTPLSGLSYFEASFRYYRELNPSTETEDAGLEESHYFLASLTTYGGMFISYSNGRLPFDLENKETYHLGFSYNF